VNLRQTPAFLRRVRKLPPRERDAVARALRRFAADPFDPALRTHKLAGQLEGRWAFAAAYDLRVVCRIEGEVAHLLTVGTHDTVY
jgi:mRNA interferase YafQ